MKLVCAILRNWKECYITVPRQDKTLFILSKYIILRPGTANSVANLGWPGNKIKNKQKKTAVTIYKLNILGREEKKTFIQKEKNGLDREVMKKKKTKMLMMGRRYYHALLDRVYLKCLYGL